MPLKGVDTTHTLDIAALHQAGIVAVGGYSSGGWKQMPKSFLDALRAAGIGGWVCWETTTTRALQGRAAGQADARAHNAAMDALGFPDYVAACWTLDTDVANDGTAASEYAYGWHEASRRPSAAYAEASVIDAGMAAGVIVTGWQSNASSWSAGRLSVHASILQGVNPVIPDTDPDLILDPNTSLIWWPDGHQPPAPAPAGQQPPGELIMDAEARGAFNALGTQIKDAVDLMARKPFAVTGPNGMTWVCSGTTRFALADQHELDIYIWTGQCQGYGTAGPAKVDDVFLSEFRIIPGPK